MGWKREDSEPEGGSSQGTSSGWTFRSGGAGPRVVLSEDASKDGGNDNAQDHTADDDHDLLLYQRIRKESPQTSWGCLGLGERLGLWAELCGVQGYWRGAVMRAEGWRV